MTTVAARSTRRPLSRTPGWVWLVGATLLGLVAGFLALTVLLGRDDASTRAGVDQPAATTPTTVVISPAANPRLEAGGQDMLGAAGGSLAAFAGRPVEARDLTVLAVVGGDGLWAGPAPEAQVFVRVSDGADVDVGRRISFDGTVVKLGGKAGAYGVTDRDGADRLERQGHVIEVASVRSV